MTLLLSPAPEEDDPINHKTTITSETSIKAHLHGTMGPQGLREAFPVAHLPAAGPVSEASLGRPVLSPTGQALSRMETHRDMDVY